MQLVDFKVREVLFIHFDPGERSLAHWAHYFKRIKGKSKVHWGM